jgi:caa(3)-type oxidase subunit IV
MSEQSKSSAMRTGVVVLVVLAVLTVAEFVVGTVTNGSLVPLAIIALIKAALIIQYFMHAPRVLRSDQEGGGH